jgi:hypothetical protein
MNPDRPNGCGPWFLPDIIPDGPESLWEKPCDEHDRLYREGGGFKEKHHADFLLYKRSVDAINHFAIRRRRMGILWARFYLVMVLIFGFLTFNWWWYKLIKSFFKKV